MYKRKNPWSARERGGFYLFYRLEQADQSALRLRRQIGAADRTIWRRGGAPRVEPCVRYPALHIFALVARGVISAGLVVPVTTPLHDRCNTASVWRKGRVDIGHRAKIDDLGVGGLSRKSSKGGHSVILISQK
jgi:hypothetical protein